MNDKPDPIRQFEQLVVARGKIPERVTLVRYDSLKDWLLPGEEADNEDFESAKNSSNDFDSYLTSRGVEVVLVRFDPAAYSAWLQGRPDTRDNRAQWSLDQ